MREFKSFYKIVQGNEGQKCHYSTRLDTYGCGCSHDCKYCYAKALLSFRDLWHPNDPSVADISKIENKIKSLEKGAVVRLGGMTDCFQPCEKVYKITYKTIQLLNKYGIHYLIVTKSNLVARDDYIKILDKNLAHIQITVTSTSDLLASQYENAMPISKRIEALEKLNSKGFDVALRVSPFIPEYIDFQKLNKIKCKKIIIEFLRVNNFIKKTFNIDYSLYTHNEGGYSHLPLKVKKELIKKINGFEQISVCEDCSEAYKYWKTHINYNPSDCCNLTFPKEKRRYYGNLNLLNNKKIGFLSSQKSDSNTVNSLQSWAKNINDNDCIVSGFQSKTEKELLRLAIKYHKNVIMVLSYDIADRSFIKFQELLKLGKMLIIEPFDNNLKKTNRNAAKTRNQFIVDISDDLFIGDITIGGMIDEITIGKNFKLLGVKFNAR